MAIDSVAPQGAALRLGIDIGGTKMLGVVVSSIDGTHEVINEARVPTPAHGDIVGQIVDFARSFGRIDSVGVPGGLSLPSAAGCCTGLGGGFGVTFGAGGFQSPSHSAHEG